MKNTKHLKQKKALNKIMLLAGVFFFFTNMSNAQKKASKISNELERISLQKKNTSSVLKSTSTQNKHVKILNDKRIKQENVNTDYILISAIATKSTATLKKDLQKLGLKNAASYGGLVTGLFPTNSIDKLNSVKSLRHANKTHKPSIKIGAVTTEGDEAQTSDLIRAKYNIDGTGITIGTLSDSYDVNNIKEDVIASGDLPGTGNPDGYNTDIVVLEEISDTEIGTDEGRGMMEIIHDIAPGAKQIFHSALNGRASFAEGIIELAEAGCDIIVDDVTYWEEPNFQDGIISQAVDKVVNEYGVEFFSAVGNNEENSFETSYRPSDEPTAIFYEGEFVGNYILHDFDEDENTTNYYQKFTVGFGAELSLTFQWDEPYASVCEGCPGPETDFDIFIMLEKDPTSTFFFSFDDNIGSGESVEIIDFIRDDVRFYTAYLVIGKYVDDSQPVIEKPNYFKIINNSASTVAFDGIELNKSTCYGHSNSKNSTSVGYANWNNTPIFSGEAPVINNQSSSGGTPIFYDTKGNRLKNTETRLQPKIIAPSNGKTYSFGSFRPNEDFGRFGGSSAAAPHAAAAAALLKQLQNNTSSNTPVSHFFISTAIDMDDPNTEGFDTGFDFKTGYGFIQAEKAAEALLNKINNKSVFSQTETNQNVLPKIKIASIYPNPVESDISINLVSNKETIVNLNIYSFSGTLSQSKQLKILQGNNTIEEELKELNSGLYLIKIQDLNGSELAKYKFLKK